MAIVLSWKRDEFVRRRNKSVDGLIRTKRWDCDCVCVVLVFACAVYYVSIGIYLKINATLYQLRENEEVCLRKMVLLLAAGTLVNARGRTSKFSKTVFPRSGARFCDFVR